MKISRVKLWDRPALSPKPGRPGGRLKKAGMIKVWRHGCLLGVCLVLALTFCAPGLSYSQPPPPPGYYGNNYYGYGQPNYQPNPYPYGYYYHPYGYAPAIGPLLQGLGNALRQNVQPYEYNEERQEQYWRHHHPRGEWPERRNWHGDE
jgi:hypothetical protein